MLKTSSMPLFLGLDWGIHSILRVILLLGELENFLEPLANQNKNLKDDPNLDSTSLKCCLFFFVKCSLPTYYSLPTPYEFFLRLLRLVWWRIIDWAITIRVIVTITSTTSSTFILGLQASFSLLLVKLASTTTKVYKPRCRRCYIIYIHVIQFK